MAISAWVWRCTSNNTSASEAFSAWMRSIPLTKVTLTKGIGGSGALASRGGAVGDTPADTEGAATLGLATFMLAAFVLVAFVLATFALAAFVLWRSEALCSFATGMAAISIAFGAAFATEPGFDATGAAAAGLPTSKLVRPCAGAGAI